jgi:hypothetical protein
MLRMEQDHEKELKEIIGDLKCPHHFRCCKRGFEDLCKAQDVGLQWYLVCLEPQPQQCKFSVLVADKYLCECPLRVYIAKKLKK